MSDKRLCVPDLGAPGNCLPSQDPASPPSRSRVPEVPGGGCIAPFPSPREPLAPCLDCRVRGPSHTPPSPAQGWPRNARRTSSGARTSAASPPCGDATRTMTARTTATRTTAVSGRRGRAGRRGTPYLARTWPSCGAATCVGQAPSGLCGRAIPLGPGLRAGPDGVRGGARGAAALEEGTPDPVADPELWARKRPSLAGPASHEPAGPRGSSLGSTTERAAFFKVAYSSRPSRAPLLLVSFL